MTIERSPKYPSFTLEECESFAQKLFSEAGRVAMQRDEIAKALGFSGLTGSSAKAFASLRGYGFLDKSAGGKYSCSESAIRIIRPSSEEDRKEALHQAAFAPEIFQTIRERYDDCSERILASQLIRLGYTDDGAKKTAQIYHENRSFAASECALNPPHSIGGKEEPANTQQAPLAASRMLPSEGEIGFTKLLDPSIKYFVIPTDAGEALIPLGMSKDDFDLFQKALELFKAKIVKNSESSTPL